MTKRKITLKGLLELIQDEVEYALPLGNRPRFYQPYHPLDDYFHSVVQDTVNRLERKGWVKLINSPEGIKVKITKAGKQQILFFRLDSLKPREEAWDGRWRIIFVDIAEIDKIKRNKFRKYLKQLGLKQIQKSVWISPQEIRDEIKYLREIVGVPHAVKWGILSEVENDAELRKWFVLK